MNLPGLSATARTLASFVAAAVVTATTLSPVAAAAPAAGDTYVYRLSNGYNREVRGQIQYRIDKIDADRITVAVTTDTPSLGAARTEVYAKDGNGLRHPLVNHDFLRDYEFAPAYPAYVFPLDPGKSWSVRVTAVDPATGRRNSVRVDGEVLGSERITVPAGAFDTIKVRRYVYAGDWEGFRHETNITEIDWYAPVLGRPVRTESKSEYLDTSRATGGGILGGPIIHGDWTVLELAAASTAKP